MLATEMFSGKPDAGNPPVRFDERGAETEHRSPRRFSKMLLH